jgi:uncharacterized protein with HEPN domain
MNKALRAADYLAHLGQAIERISGYCGSASMAEFMANPMLQDAVIRNLEVIGEAARNIERHAPEFAQQHSEIPWAVLYAMRNRLSHGYDTIDLEIVWTMVMRDLPALRAQLNALG